jgi:pimeloyl-ACP methyl ester carboxylesterase
MAGIGASLLGEYPSGQLALCGFSMGGYAALAAAAAAPERIAGLFLLNSHTRPDTAEARARRGASASRVAAGGAAALVEVAGELACSLLHPSRVPPGDAGAAARRAVAGGSGAGSCGVAAAHPAFAAFVRGAAAVGCDAFRAQQLANAGREDAAPVMALLGARGAALATATGSHDALIPRALAAESLAHAAGAGRAAGGLTVFPDCGHLSPLEAPEAVAEAVGRWVGALL